MNRRIIVILIIIAVVGIILYFLFRKKKDRKERLSQNNTLPTRRPSQNEIEQNLNDPNFWDQYKDDPIFRRQYARALNQKATEAVRSLIGSDDAEFRDALIGWMDVFKREQAEKSPEYIDGLFADYDDVVYGHIASVLWYYVFQGVKDDSQFAQKNPRFLPTTFEKLKNVLYEKTGNTSILSWKLPSWVVAPTTNPTLTQNQTLN